MIELLLKTQTADSRIVVGKAPLEETIQQAALVIADRNVAELHPELLRGAKLLAIDAGEGAKSLSSAERLFAACLEHELDRSSLVFGVGGGTICDLVGFVAATYLRGVRCALAPTTLLAQVDASIGGKNGINFAGAKNLIGTIAQPELCLCDPRFLDTLPRNLLADGFAEVIKHALISKGPLLEILEERNEPLSTKGLERIVLESVLVKKTIVEADERETGERRKLNLGHTIGHALELTLGISHGASVALGVLLEMKISEGRGLISSGLRERCTSLFLRYGLPIQAQFSGDEILALARRDKKRYGNTYKIPLITGLGRVEMADVPETELAAVLALSSSR